MKRILTLALCATVAGGMFAQKAVVDQAAKLKGKADKIAEARSLIEQASKNPETANDVRTYYVGGKNEFDLYDNARTKQMINPQDKSIDPMAMAEQLINGYNMYVRALPWIPCLMKKVKSRPNTPRKSSPHSTITSTTSSMPAALSIMPRSSIPRLTRHL